MDRAAKPRKVAFVLSARIDGCEIEHQAGGFISAKNCRQPMIHDKVERGGASRADVDMKTAFGMIMPQLRQPRAEASS